MDVRTAAGRITQQQEAQAIEIFERSTGYTFVHTPPDRPAYADGFVLKDGVIQAVVEIKCRNLTRSSLESFGGEALLSLDKVLRCREVAYSLRVPFSLWMFLVPDKELLVQRVTNHDGSIASQFRAKFETTQATVNGGKMDRNTAYLSLDGVKVFR